MKRKSILAFVVCTVLAGCAPSSKELERSVSISGYDFTPYTSKGFFISPEQYLLPYDPIGMITVTFSPEVKKHIRFTSYDSTKYTLASSLSSEWIVERIDVRMVIEQLYRQGIKMGADAVVRFNVSMKPMTNGDLLYFASEVSGFAIKRK
jgi:hypothetical protein